MSTQALIIDDDPLSIKVIETLLREEGLAVASLLDPADLEPKLTEIPRPRVVFLDLEMPNLDGYEVLDLLRAQFGKDVLVAAYTVHISETNKIIARGFDGLFAKPLDYNTFSVNLQALLGGQRVWGR